MPTPTVDLTVSGNFGEIGGGLFTTGLLQPAGSGVFDAFLQIQNKGTEQGYNTDAAPQYDEKNSHVHNHSILLADVPIVVGDGSNGTLEGVVYREFLLDLNEAGGGKRTLSLDALQIWQQESGSLTGFIPGAGFAGAHTNYLAYDLDAGGDNWIALDAGLSHGSGQSDVRILIRNDLFINDAAHRYVTLYSAFGQQGGVWAADGGFEEWGLHGSSGGAKSALALDKTAVIDGGTADTAGEIISYSFTLSNTGNTAQTGITLVDASVSNLTRGVDLIGNNDTILHVGEVWSYTASYTVTQADIDSADSGGDITNTATADSDQTIPISDSTSILIERRPIVTLEKTGTVADGAADEAGDVIDYTITISNDGNTTLTNVAVEESTVVVSPVLNLSAPIFGDSELLVPVLSGDYNVGDTDEDGVEDPGETFVFVNAGDENQNGALDPGETFQFETIGYRNAGDTNQDGVEDPGETFQFTSTPVVPAAVDADFNGFNDGDTNEDGNLSVGETWQYSLSYTLTQDDIDQRNGGVPTIVPGLTHDNTASVTTDQGVASNDTVLIVVEQNPEITVTKVADVTAVDAAGDEINCTVTVENSGNMSLSGVAISDSLTDLTLTSGDLDTDNELDVGETWTYMGSYVVQQADIDNGGVVANPALTLDNTATVTTDQGAGGTDSASVLVEQNPSLVLAKAATVPGDTADAAGEVISYSITVTNNGNMTLSNVEVIDPSVSNLDDVDLDNDDVNDGDTNLDGNLNIGETWQYTATHVVTQAEMDAGGTIDNSASVTTGQGASANDTASIVVEQNAGVTLDKAGVFVDEDDDGFADVGEHINYTFTITNTGNVTLHEVNVNDETIDIVGPAAYLSLAPDAIDSTSWSGSYAITANDITNGYHDNTAVVTALEISASSGNEHVLFPI